jgi:hypothetical protein
LDSAVETITIQTNSTPRGLKNQGGRNPGLGITRVNQPAKE